MHHVALRLDPRALPNPDTDLRIALPALLVARSQGAIREEGWGYIGEDPAYMMFFLTTDDLLPALSLIATVLEKEEVLGNHLAPAATVAVKEGASYRVVSPQDFVGTFETGE